MSRSLTTFAGLLVYVTTSQSYDHHACASEEAARQYKTLVDQYEEDGDAREVAGSFITLAEQNPKSPIAVESLVWVVVHVRRGKDLGQAITLLTSNYLQSERLEEVCQKLPFRPSPASEELLRSLRTESPHEAVRAHASFHLAVYLQVQLGLIEAIKQEAANQRQFEQFYGKRFTEHLLGLDTAASVKETEAIYEDVARLFSDVPVDDSTMGKIAERQLYAIRNLSVGRTAPEIAGQDVDGKTFKLSDYRGKVVLLDFWGHW